MNTINNINTNNMNAISSTIESKQTTAASKTCWMTDVAGFLFWGTVAFQFLCVVNDIIDWEFANHIIYNILPLTGALAYFGLRRDLGLSAGSNETNSQITGSDC